MVRRLYQLTVDLDTTGTDPTASFRAGADAGLAENSLESLLLNFSGGRFGYLRLRYGLRGVSTRRRRTATPIIEAWTARTVASV
jgi:hypothetical protein